MRREEKTIELLLEEITDSTAIYKYVTVGEEVCSYGRILIDRNTGDVHILKRDGSGYQSSLRHAVLTVHSFFEENLYPKKREVAWY
jgi:hypothetical protein